jgi:methionyl aminopeptidase
VSWTQSINLKSPREIDLMAAAGRSLAKVFLRLRDGEVRAGVKTRDLDDKVERWIRDMNCVPSFKGYHGYPASVCISINEEVVHGIPGDRVIEDGDIVGIDIGLIQNGWHADSAETFLVGDVEPESRELCETTLQGLQAGLDACVAGNRIADIGRAVEKHAKEKGYGVVEQLVGHGIGTSLHEDPQVPNYECMTMPNPKIEVGLVLAIEPMFNLGGKEVLTLPDEWTVITADRKRSAHYEHTVAITEEGPKVLTDR